MNNPLVSVIIPTYKSRGGLQKSINSVLSQTYRNIEILVIDDNDPNSDERKKTESEMEIYSDNGNVIYIKHECNKNGAAARNTGIRASHGEFIAFLDDDDSWYPKKIENQLEFFQERRDVDAVYTFTQSGNKQPWVIPFEDNVIIPLLMNRSRMYTSTLLMTRKSVEAIGGFDESFRRHQDYDLLVRFFDAGFKIGCLKKILVLYTPLGGNSLRNKDFIKLKDQFLDAFDGVLNKLDKNTPGLKKRIYAANYSLAFYLCVSQFAFKDAINVFIHHFFDSPKTFLGQIVYQMKCKMKSKVLD